MTAPIRTVPRDRLAALRARAEQRAIASEEAIAINAAILELDPDDMAAANRLGRSLADMTRLDEALTVFRDALQRHPTNDIAARRIKDSPVGSGTA